MPLITFWIGNHLCHSLEGRDVGRSDMRVHCAATALKRPSFRVSCGLGAFFFLSSLVFYLFRAATNRGIWRVPGQGSNWSCCCQPTPQPQQRRILNLLSKSRDRTHNLIVPSRIHFHCTTTGTPGLGALKEQPDGLLCGTRSQSGGVGWSEENTRGKLGT